MLAFQCREYEVREFSRQKIMNNHMWDKQIRLRWWHYGNQADFKEEIPILLCDLEK